MNIKKCIFLTGATGFLGSYILRELLVKGQVQILLLVRARDPDAARGRITDILLRFFPAREVEKYFENIVLCHGDLSSSSLEHLSRDQSIPWSSVKAVIHCAANTDFRIDLKKARKDNVNSLENLLDFLMRKKWLNEFHYISTVFVAGKYEGHFDEKQFDLGQSFKNSYEQSKFESEQLLRKISAINNFPISIYRPTIISGEYRSGRTFSFKMFYQPALFFYQELFTCVPLNPSTAYNFIPVDTAAQAVVLLVLAKNLHGVFHIGSRQNLRLDHLMEICSTHLKVALPGFVSQKIFSESEKSFVKKKLIEPFVPYFNYKSVFDCQITHNILEKFEFRFPEIDDMYIYRILDYCKKVGFLKAYS